MTFGELKDLIRFEAKIKGADTLTGFIERTINEILRKYTAKGFFPELLLTNVALTNPGAGIANWTLPADVQHWLPDRVYFSEGGSYADSFRLGEGRFGRNNAGYPRLFRRAGAVLQTWPYADTNISSAIWIDYYKRPALITNDTIPFPIDSLESTVRLETVARISRYGDSDMSKVYKAEAYEAFQSTQSETDMMNQDA